MFNRTTGFSFTSLIKASVKQKQSVPGLNPNLSINSTLKLFRESVLQGAQTQRLNLTSFSLI